MKKNSRDLVVRRVFSQAEKMAILKEIADPAANVSAVAKKHHLSPPLLFNWRRRYANVSPAITTIAQPSQPESGLHYDASISPEAARRIQALEKECEKLKSELFKIKSFLGGKLYEMETQNEH